MEGGNRKSFETMKEEHSQYDSEVSNDTMANIPKIDESGSNLSA